MTPHLVRAIAARVLHERTFMLVIEPTLADLELEAATGEPRRRAQAHTAAWRALALAVCHDVIWDERGPAWQHSARIVATASALVVAYHAALVVMVLGFDSRAKPLAAQLALPTDNASLAGVIALVFGAGASLVVRRTRQDA